MNFREIISFEKACQIKGISTNLPDVSSWPHALRRPLIAFYKLTVIRDAIVGDWVADWNNSKQLKWFPWFYLDKPGFRFYVTRYVLPYSVTTGGPRLCFETEEQAKYAAITFLTLWEEWIACLPGELAEEERSMVAHPPVAITEGPTKLHALELAMELVKCSPPGPMDIMKMAKEIYEWLCAA